MLAIFINHRLFAVTNDGLRRDVAIGLMLDRLLHEHAGQFQPDLHSLVFNLGKASAPFRARRFAINVFSKFSSDVGQFAGDFGRKRVFRACHCDIHVWGGRKKLFNIVPAPTVSDDINRSPQQPTRPRVTDICRLLILTLLLVEHDIQTLSRTRMEYPTTIRLDIRSQIVTVTRDEVETDTLKPAMMHSPYSSFPLEF